MKYLLKYLLISHELVLYREGRWQFKLNKKDTVWEVDFSSVILFFAVLILWSVVQ